MNPDRRRAILGAMTTLCGCAIVYAIILGHHLYAPGARELQQRIASYDDFQNPVLNSYALGSAIYLGLRKLYGAIAFAILGFCTSTIFARPARLARTALLIGIVRAGLEIAERLAHHGDSTLETLLDIVTGTAAGTLGALAFNTLAKRAKWEPEA